MMRLLLIAGLGAAIGAPAAFGSADAKRATTAVAAAPSSPVSYRRDVVPIFTTYCTMCHQDSVAMGALSLLPGSARNMLVDIPSYEAPLKRIAPGAPGRSYLINKLAGTHAAVGGKGLAMPIGGAPVPAQDLDTLRRWIAQGAPDN